MAKIALVTGSTVNIGKAIAQRLARDGYRVVVTSRHEEEVKQVSASLPTPGGYYALDFADPRQIESLFAYIADKFGGIDVLVNNVAYTKNESIFDCDEETWERTIHTNLRSYYLCMRHAARMMRDAGKGGSIVNVTISVTRGVPNKFSYTTSKGGVNFMTMSAALDLAPYGIRVNAIGSGMVGTPVGHRTSDRPRENAAIPLGHIGAPEDVAHAVAFLVSEEASFITGALLPVDGGGFVGHSFGSAGHHVAFRPPRSPS
ncbi:SDR family oxidoreductase [Pendulispora brunnea]|uniref:SDR family oxidoreductase n=1 Tax=Pendulispora brunnea TaxID=2905690 RepID=A0ABZ2K9V6_9BACT